MSGIGMRANVMAEEFCARTGALIRRQRVSNRVVDTGLQRTRDLLQGIKDPPHRVAVGTGTADVEALDEALAQEVFTREIDRRQVEGKRLTCQVFLSETEANGNLITEVGLKSEQGVLYNRALLEAPINKTSGVTVTITVELELEAIEAV
jgi:hypothetical protein